MTRLIFLGTASAVPDEQRENTSLAIQSKDTLLLVDCGNNVFVRMKKAGLDVLELSHLILTHFHPDHVSGVPSLLMNCWLLGRKKKLDIYGLDHTITRAQQMMALYSWEKWPGFYPVEFHILPEKEMEPVFDVGEFKVFSSPVRHWLPTIGLRFEFKTGAKTAAYSSDTEPCISMVRLANGVDLLIHEATGNDQGHSTARQAGAIARQAGVAGLYLIHYPSGSDEALNGMVEDAREEYQKPVTLARDLMDYEFS